MSLIIKNDIDSELRIEHSAGEQAVTLLSSELKQGSVGVGQTWQLLLSSRSIGVNYTNNTGKPIEVSIRVPTGGNFGFTVSGVAFSYFVEANFTVPNGETYSVNSGNSLTTWNELR